MFFRNPFRRAFLAPKAPIYITKVNLFSHFGFPRVPKCSLGAPIFGQKGDKGGVSTRTLSILETTLRPTTPKTIQNRIFIDLSWILDPFLKNLVDVGSIFTKNQRNTTTKTTYKKHANTTSTTHATKTTQEDNEHQHTPFPFHLSQNYPIRQPIFCAMARLVCIYIARVLFFLTPP